MGRLRCQYNRVVVGGAATSAGRWVLVFLKQWLWREIISTMMIDFARIRFFFSTSLSKYPAIERWPIQLEGV